MKWVKLFATVAMLHGVAARVTWTLEFAPSPRTKKTEWQTRQMVKSFVDPAEAFQFFAHHPVEGEPFECVESWYGQSGYCVVRDVRYNGDANPDGGDVRGQKFH